MLDYFRLFSSCVLDVTDRSIAFSFADTEKISPFGERCAGIAPESIERLPHVVVSYIGNANIVYHSANFYEVKVEVHDVVSDDGGLGFFDEEKEGFEELFFVVVVENVLRIGTGCGFESDCNDARIDWIESGGFDVEDE